MAGFRRDGHIFTVPVEVSSREQFTISDENVLLLMTH